MNCRSSSCDNRDLSRMKWFTYLHDAKAAGDHQKSYANNRHKPLEFEVGDRVMLKVSPWKGVVHFGKKGKLAPRGYYKPGTRAWVRWGSRKIRIPIDMYLCRVEERLTIKLVKGEEENVIYDISDSDSDLEPTARSGPRDGEMEDTGGSGIRTNA
ncbi:hypothetical protein Tco_1075522 [Tanacetum coccineum]